MHLPHQPELESVDLTTALETLVACVETDVVELILLEQVRG